MLSKFTLVIAIVGLTAPAVLAAAPNPRAEQKVNRVELRQDRRALRADRADLIRLQALHAAYKKARAERNLAAIKRLDKRTMTELRAEKRESRREARQAAAEATRSRAEVRRGNQAVRRAVAQDRPAKAAAEAARLADDRRDLRSDIVDIKKEHLSQARRVRIQRDFSGYMGRMDPKSLAAKQALIKELMTMARVEITRDRAEIREDKAEIREDRREMRRRKK